MTQREIAAELTIENLPDETYDELDGIMAKIKHAATNGKWSVTVPRISDVDVRLALSSRGFTIIDGVQSEHEIIKWA